LDRSVPAYPHLGGALVEYKVGDETPRSNKWLDRCRPDMFVEINRRNGCRAGSKTDMGLVMGAEYNSLARMKAHVTEGGSKARLHAFTLAVGIRVLICCRNTQPHRSRVARW